jgi:hypothetical protein
MSAIQTLLQRWGFVKLSRFGLELTSDGRILSTRSAVLDDGAGGRIVGWHDGDVSIWKLSRWAEAVGPDPAVVPRRTSAPAPAPAPAAPARPPVNSRILPDISAASMTKDAPIAASPPAAPRHPSARVIPVEVAGDAPVDEDDWEWTIALARARVAVEEAETAQPPEPSPRLAPIGLRTPDPSRIERLTPRPIAAVTGDAATSGEWPKTEAIGAIDYEDYRVATRPSIPVPRVAPRPTPAPPATIAIPRTAAPSTVIPVPVLPTIDAARMSRMEPVRTSSSSRLAKGTGPLDSEDPPARRQAMLLEDTVPDYSVGDRTRPGIAPPRRAQGTPPHEEPTVTSVGERTQPGIALPAAARAVQLPSIKRRSAPR